MKVLLNIFLFCVLVLCYCCKGDSNKETNITEIISLPRLEPKKFEKPEQLVAFINNTENGFIKSKTLDQITYYGVLKPVDFLLAQKRLSENNDTLQKEDFEDLQYFDLRIKINDFTKEFIKYDLESPQQYRDRIDYCAFGMQHDIKLIDGKDTLNCVLFHFERGFDVIPYGHFILGFENQKNIMVNTKTLMFNDRLFNNGIIKFSFAPELMVNEPALL